MCKLGKMPQKRMECFRQLLDHLAWIERQFLSGIRDSGSLWGMMIGVGGVRKSIHQSWLAKGLKLGLGLLCWGFKGIQEEIPLEEVLCFDLLTRPKMPFKVVHRKEVTHPGRWKSEEVAQALRHVYITAWEFEGNIRPTNWGQLEIGEKEGK